MKKSLLMLILISLTTASLCFSSGFGIYDANARATGMSSAFVARADDASAIYYNPAGIAFLEGTNVLFNATLVQPHVDITFNGETTSSEQRWVSVPSVFVSRKITENIAVGIGIFAPIGLGVQYPGDFSGAMTSYRSMGMAAFIRPAIAIKLNDKLSVGAGLDFVYSRMKVWRKLPYQMLGIPMDGFSVDARNELDGSGMGFSLGLLYKANEQIQIGLKYRHEVELDYNGDVDFTLMKTGSPMVDGMLGSMFYDQKLESDMTIPSEFSIGVLYKATEDFSIEADVVFTNWSSVDTIPLKYEVEAINQDWEMNWEDTWMFKIGAEYWLNREFAVRAGYTLDNTPIPVETLTPFAPDADRNEFTVGLGYDSREACCWGRFFVDVAFRYILLDDVTSEFPWYPAEFSTNMTFFSVTTGFNF